MLSFSPSFFPLFPPVSLIAFNSPFLHLRTLGGCKIAHKIEKKKHDTWYSSNTRERKQTILPSSIPGSPVFSINLNSYQSSHVNYVHTGNNGNIQSRFRIIQFIQSFALNFSTPPRNSEMVCPQPNPQKQARCPDPKIGRALIRFSFSPVQTSADGPFPETKANV